MNENIRLHVIIQGTVQGVGFRNIVLDTAATLDVTGWVRNRWDGSVEVMAEGIRPALEKLLSRLYLGPRSADVRAVQREWSEATGEFPGFNLRRTE